MHVQIATFCTFQAETNPKTLLKEIKDQTEDNLNNISPLIVPFRSRFLASAPQPRQPP